jgi:hypothetical protein
VTSPSPSPESPIKSESKSESPIGEPESESPKIGTRVGLQSESRVRVLQFWCPVTYLYKFSMNHEAFQVLFICHEQHRCNSVRRAARLWPASTKRVQILFGEAHVGNKFPIGGHVPLIQAVPWSRLWRQSEHNYMLHSVTSSKLSFSVSHVNSNDKT